jgi:hypothetical protein
MARFFGSQGCVAGLLKGNKITNSPSLEFLSAHSEAAAVIRRTHPILCFASGCGKSRSDLTRTGLPGYQFFLNFDVAILFNRAQHLLALARKVEQGGLNG